MPRILIWLGACLMATGLILLFFIPRSNAGGWRCMDNLDDAGEIIAALTPSKCSTTIFGIAYHESIGKMVILKTSQPIDGDKIVLQIDNEGTITLPIIRENTLALGPITGTLIYRLKKGRTLKVTTSINHNPCIIQFPLTGSNQTINHLP